MPRPFKFRHVNRISGAFVLLVLVVVIAGVVVTARAQKWFAPMRNLTLVLPEEGSLGLRAGAEVQVRGVVVGSVTRLYVQKPAPGARDDDGRMLAEVRIEADYLRFLHRDSQAVIRRSLGIAGDAYVEITRGQAREPLEPGAPIAVAAGGVPAQAMEDTILELRREVIPAVRKLHEAADEFARLATELRDPDGRLQQTLAHAQHVAASVEKQEGIAGKLLADPDLARQLEELVPRLEAVLVALPPILKDIHQTTAALPEMAAAAKEDMKQLPELLAQVRASLHTVQALLQDAQKTTAELPALVGKVDRTAQTLPGLVLQTQETMRQVQILVEGVQKHWLVRAYIEPEQPTARIAPEDVGERVTP